MNNSDKNIEIKKSIAKFGEIFKNSLKISFYKDVVFSLLFLKYISDAWQCAHEFAKNKFGSDFKKIEEFMLDSRIVLPGDNNFESLFKQRFDIGNGDRIAAVFAAIVAENRMIFPDDFSEKLPFSIDWPSVKDSKKDKILIRLLERFHQLQFNNDIKKGTMGVGICSVFDFLLDLYSSTSDQKKEEFYTPPEVSSLIMLLMAPQPNESVCDPFCGTGSLLLHFKSMVQNPSEDLMPKLFGQDISSCNRNLATINVLFNKAENQCVIRSGDAIKDPQFVVNQQTLQKFDIVVAHPPATVTDWGYYSAMIDPYERFHFGVPPKTKGNYAFILHMLNCMKKSGRMAVIVPHGVLFRGADEKRIRKNLVLENLLDAVIGLPEKLFYRGNMSAAIMVFKKNKTDTNVLFIDASRSFQVGRSRNLLKKEDLSSIVDLYINRKNVQCQAYLACQSDMDAHDYNLNIPLYIDTEEYEKFEYSELAENNTRLKKEAVELDTEIMKICQKLLLKESI
jgi:type I restriction enzyme M protein